MPRKTASRRWPSRWASRFNEAAARCRGKRYTTLALDNAWYRLLQ